MNALESRVSSNASLKKDSNSLLSGSDSLESGGFVQRFIEKKIPIHFQARAPSAADGDGGVGTEDGWAASELRPDRPARSIYLPILKFFKRGSVTTGVIDI